MGTLESSVLVDPYNRPITSLRISITQRCNFNCFFCHQEGENRSGEELSIDEIETLVKVGTELGIRKVKITGGEPLLREDIVEIIERISPYVEEVSMTTNGYSLSDLECKLKKAGLARVNVSLHSSHPERLCKIIGLEALEEIRMGVKRALECNLKPVKLNMVVMKGFNDNEIEEMIEYSKNIGTTLQLIEFQPLEKGETGFNQYHFDLSPLEKELKNRSKRIIRREMHRRNQYILENDARVEIVRPMHNTEFCQYCTRLRITSDGYLKPCLMREDNYVEAVSIIRKDSGNESLINAFKEAVNRREPYWRG